jgi:hypothetical protein
MTAREVESATMMLERKQVRTREAAAAAVVCTMLTGATLPLSLAAAVASLVGSAVATTIALANFASRRDLVARLALDPRAHVIADVREYATRLALPAERQKLAAWLLEIVYEATPGDWYLTDRVARYAAQLELLATELASSWARVLPASAAACRHLLTEAVESPLYNPDIAAEELPATIQRIRRGITR